MENINWDEMLLPYEQAVNELTVKFQSLATGYEQLGLPSPIELVSHRVKKPSSILAKAKRKGVALKDIEKKIEDIAGIRLICRFVEDISRVVRIIKARDGMDLYIKDERDYLTQAKPSGYRSYHIIVAYPLICALGKREVPCEIQIRTMAMNYWSIIEHDLQYKHDGKLPLNIKERLLYCAIKTDDMDKHFSLIHQDCGIRDIEMIQSKQPLVDELIKNIRLLRRAGKTEQAQVFNMKLLDMYDVADLQDYANLIDETRGILNSLD